MAENKTDAANEKGGPLPRIKLQTNKGEIVLELFEDEAPNTVANFVNLIEKEFYDGLTFHRVIPGFVAQGGCPQGTGTGGPGHHIACECVLPGHHKHQRGVISMAHAGRNTGGSQFFLTLADTPHLDGEHTVFGRITEGMEVLDQLVETNPGVSPDRIEQATVLEKRDHEYVPETLPGR